MRLLSFCYPNLISIVKCRLVTKQLRTSFKIRYTCVSYLCQCTCICQFARINKKHHMYYFSVKRSSFSRVILILVLGYAIFDNIVMLSSLYLLLPDKFKINNITIFLTSIPFQLLYIASENK